MRSKFLFIAKNGGCVERIAGWPIVRYDTGVVNIHTRGRKAYGHVEAFYVCILFDVSIAGFRSSPRALIEYVARQMN